MNKAVFLDRDGVINEDVDHLSDVADLRVLPGAAEAITALNRKGYCIVVITNQGGIAKGLIRPEAVGEIHDELTARLAGVDARIDRIYYCPHHPGGVVAEYAIVCDCRKPETGMLRRAVDDFDIDIAQSYLVGDKGSDILAGQRMGLRTILVKGNHVANDIAGEVTPDFFADNLRDALVYIV